MKKLSDLPLETVFWVIKNCNSLAKVLKTLECQDNSNNRFKLQSIINKYNLDITHFQVRSNSITKEKYTQNPNSCKNCGKFLSFAKRKNVFCSKSCAIIYNNKRKKINRPFIAQSKIDTLSDEEFTNIILTSKGWKEISSNLGYNNIISDNVRTKILNRCNNLGLTINTQTLIPITDQTKEELFTSRKNWQSARSSIVHHAAKLFYKNNPHPKCAICGYNKHIEVAHIKAVADFSDTATIKEINDITNLIGLCPNHHWEYDNGYLKYDVNNQSFIESIPEGKNKNKKKDKKVKY